MWWALATIPPPMRTTGGRPARRRRAAWAATCPPVTTATSVLPPLTPTSSMALSWEVCCLLLGLLCHPARRKALCRGGQRQQSNDQIEISSSQASKAWATAEGATRPETSGLRGEDVCAGPAQDDSYMDSRSNYQQNEPAVDYNSGFTGES